MTDRSDFVDRRRWQADLIERDKLFGPGDWNVPEMLRDDAAEIERLTANYDTLLTEHTDLIRDQQELTAVVSELQMVMKVIQDFARQSRRAEDPNPSISRIILLAERHAADAASTRHNRDV